MLMNSKSLVSVSEASQGFSRVARMVDETGHVIIMKNNKPRYILLRYEEIEAAMEASSDSDEKVSTRIAKQFTKSRSED